jgi:hypothetical protein
VRDGGEPEVYSQLVEDALGLALRPVDRALQITLDLPSSRPRYTFAPPDVLASCLGVTRTHPPQGGFPKPDFADGRRTDIT